MKQNNKYTRSFFIKSVFAGLTIGFVALLDKTISIQKKINQKKVFSFSFNANKEITFYDDFIIINKEDKIKVFSSRCTHLGCKIDNSKNGQLLCPCHGSTFDLDGNATKGPAIKPLKEIDYKINELKEQITVEV